MFSRAPCADLKGKKAARLTMLVNFAILVTHSSTYNNRFKMLVSRKAANIQKMSLGVGGRIAYHRKKHADLLHFFDREQGIACGMFEQHMQLYLKCSIMVSN